MKLRIAKRVAEDPSRYRDATLQAAWRRLDKAERLRRRTAARNRPTSTGLSKLGFTDMGQAFRLLDSTVFDGNYRVGLEYIVPSILRPGPCGIRHTMTEHAIFVSIDSTHVVAGLHITRNHELVIHDTRMSFLLEPGDIVQVVIFENDEPFSGCLVLRRLESEHRAVPKPIIRTGSDISVFASEEP